MFRGQYVWADQSILSGLLNGMLADLDRAPAAENLTQTNDAHLLHNNKNNYKSFFQLEMNHQC